MDVLQTLSEAMDHVFNSMDGAIESGPDSVLTEAQIDAEIDERIDSYLEDAERVFDALPEETKKYFDEHLDEMLEATDPEMMFERNIVRLDRNAVLNQLTGLFCLVIARKRRDPAFTLYKKGSAIRRKAKNTIMQKYRSRAIPISRKFLKRRKFKGV